MKHFDPRGEERDSCGTGFVANLKGVRSHDILQDALHAVSRLEHRGAVSPDGKTSDGAGVLTQIPYALFESWIEDRDHVHIAVAALFWPPADDERDRVRAIFEAQLAAEDIEVLGYREVPVDATELGATQRAKAPLIEQAVLHAAHLEGEDFERRLFATRKRVEAAAWEAGLNDFSIPSMSSQTIVYKGLVVPSALPRFFADLADKRYETAIALFHQRYSTNTFPTWRRTQPFRMLAHNGEINTLLGNVNRMRSRQTTLTGTLWHDDADDLQPLIQPECSDSMALDNVLEFLVRCGRNPVHAMAMLVPDAYESKGLEDDIRAFYRYHAAHMEPWDGPAALVFTNGRTVAAALDRNGLRPLRYWLTTDRMIVASEAGVVRVPEEEIVRKGRLGPGQMVSVNTATGRVFYDRQIKRELADLEAWKQWLDDGEVFLEPAPATQKVEDLVSHQQVFGWGREHVEKVLQPMLYDRKEPIGSMGDDTPLAVLSEKPQRFSRFFKQRFAQVTNPPIDPYREQLVMSLTTRVGVSSDLTDDSPKNAQFIEIPSPVLSSATFEALSSFGNEFASRRLDLVFEVDGGPGEMIASLESLRQEAIDAARSGVRMLVLSDRAVDERHAPIPALLGTAAIHHGLIEAGERMGVAIIVDSADVIEDHDVATLISFGAMAVHPYLALASVADVAESDPRDEGIDVEVAQRNYLMSIETGLSKIMAKLGISTVSSYRGAQTFEALGLAHEVVERYFTGTASRIGGADLAEVGRHVLAFHANAFGENERLREQGIYRFRRGGEYHAFNPLVFKSLHKAVRTQSQEAFDEYTRQVDDRPPCALRDLLTWKKAEHPIPLDEVESAESIVHRFCTQAMSFGAISREAHETLAIAMNRIGGKSNSGEGGEERERFKPYDHEATERSATENWHPAEGDWGNSAIKQVASGRFGVTPEYLVSADELEIKMAQGSKPGEGGQIPGDKVTADIAATRRSVPGITLISPPPHHDIYSIEDLAQLIYDLKRINDRATVCVKLVSVVGVGTIAAGVTKGYADTIQLSGHDGGTGASPLASIKHAGLPWELGLSEVQQTLAANGLRGRVKLRVDGGLKTGRDVVIAAMLGAEEFGFGTAPLVAAGCVMARQCHANTCPVGVATQREDLRARYPGKPEHVIAFMFYVAEHVRMILAQIGARSLDDIIGQTDLLMRRPGLPLRAETVDVSMLLAKPQVGPLKRQVARNDRPESPPLDAQILDDCRTAIAAGESFEKHYEIDNRCRSVGAALSGELARNGGAEDGQRFDLTFTGQAGQSFGVFCNKGMHLTLTGEAQDYVAKSMAGGRIAISPSATRESADVLAGNTVAYGATGGELFIAGQAGERLAVRNSGSTIVTEGCGDHGCEYMTGGVVLVLGQAGYNFGAGMSGGVAFIRDLEGTFTQRLNDELVVARRAGDNENAALTALLESHKAATGSIQAREILETGVDPTEYWMVLAR